MYGEQMKIRNNRHKIVVVKIKTLQVNIFNVKSIKSILNNNRL